MLTILQDGSTYIKAIFIDENEYEYFSELSNTRFTLEINQVYKLWSVIITGHNSEFKL